jgi:hypothetical protein
MFDRLSIQAGGAPAKRVSPIGGAQDSSADMRDAAHFRAPERHQLWIVPEQSVKSAVDAPDLPSPLEGGEDRTPDGSVQARGVSTPGRNPDAH